MAQPQSLKQRGGKASKKKLSTMASSLSLCSSFATQCRVSHLHHSPSLFQSLLSKPNFSSLPKPLNFASSPLLSTTTSFVPVSRASESEAPVIEVEAESPIPQPEPEPEPAPVIEVAADAPKREEIFAVVMIGSRQYIVIPGRFLYVQRLKGANVNDKVTLNKVLLVGTKSSIYIGKPVVTNAVVHAVVEEQGLNDKVIVFKYKKKKNYRRNIGHRQPNTRIRITGITGFEDYTATPIDTSLDP